MSPEMVRGRPYDQRSDIWSLGCLLYEICALQRAFRQDPPRVWNDVRKGRYEPLPPGAFSPQLEALVARLLSLDPRARPTAAQLLRDPLIRPHVARVRGMWAACRRGSRGGGDGDCAAAATAAADDVQARRLLAEAAAAAEEEAMVHRHAGAPPAQPPAQRVPQAPSLPLPIAAPMALPVAAPPMMMLAPPPPAAHQLPSAQRQFNSATHALLWRRPGALLLGRTSSAASGSSSMHYAPGSPADPPAGFMDAAQAQFGAGGLADPGAAAAAAALGAAGWPPPSPASTPLHMSTSWNSLAGAHAAHRDVSCASFATLSRGGGGVAPSALAPSTLAPSALAPLAHLQQAPPSPFAAAAAFAVAGGAAGAFELWTGAAARLTAAVEAGGLLEAGCGAAAAAAAATARRVSSEQADNLRLIARFRRAYGTQSDGFY